MKAKVTNVTLEVTYYNKLMLKSSIYEKANKEMNTFELSILDEEMDTTTGKTIIQFYEIKELEEIITDFKNKLNNLNKD